MTKLTTFILRRISSDLTVNNSIISTAKSHLFEYYFYHDLQVVYMYALKTNFKSHPSKERIASYIPQGFV